MDFDHLAVWDRLPIPDDRRQELYQKALTIQRDAKRQEEKTQAAQMDAKTGESKEQKDERCWPPFEDFGRGIPSERPIQQERSMGESDDVTMGPSYHHAPAEGE